MKATATVGESAGDGAANVPIGGGTSLRDAVQQLTAAVQAFGERLLSRLGGGGGVGSILRRRSLALMVRGMAVTETVVQAAGLTGEGHQLAPLAAAHRTAVLEHLLPLLGGAVLVDVFADFVVGRFARLDGHRSVAQRTDWVLRGGGTLLLLFTRHRTVVGFKTKVITAEDLLAGGALDGQEIKLTTFLEGAVFT